ncbi:MAG TPA: RcnB family protein [Phenylobacterium sp.]|nr:RcnB family protein [Phenylobacterium sp.]
MRFDRFLLSTCAAISLTWPTAVLADPPDNRGHGQGGGPAESHGQAKGQEKKADRPQQAPAPARSRAQGPAAAQHAPQRRASEPRHAPARAPRPAQRAARPAPPQLGAWERGAAAPQRAQLGAQWREQHRDWDRAAPWRSNQTWWRSNPSFRTYSGHRIGYFFFPGFGYISAPPEYRQHYWRAGDELPSWFWRYRVRNYWSYGLPTPPRGCGWIWLDGDVALVDLRDGYILDVVHNLW